jgi:hypothetical protein
VGSQSWSGAAPDDALGPVSGAMLRRCPECGNTQLTVTAEWHRADVVCARCNSAWRLQFGWLFRLPARAARARPASVRRDDW